MPPYFNFNFDFFLMNRWFSIRFLIEASTLANSLFGVIARGAPEIEGTNGSIESSLIIKYFQEKEILLVDCGKSTPKTSSIIATKRNGWISYFFPAKKN